MSTGRIGTSMTTEYDPERRQRVQRAIKRRQQKDAERCGPVTTRAMNPAEREAYGVAQPEPEGTLAIGKTGKN